MFSYMLSLIQFSLLAEKLAQERQEIQVRKKAQEKVLLLWIRGIPLLFKIQYLFSILKHTMQLFETIQENI